MNERDFLILECIAIVIAVTVNICYSIFLVIYNIKFDILNISLLYFVSSIMFFLAVISHFKRKMFIQEMQQEIKEHKKDFKHE